MTTTRKRYDSKSTEFGLWLRQQKEIESSLGYIATNLDFIWENYKTGDWMLLEEKRHKGTIKLWQKQIFDRIDKLCRADNHYKGFHRLIFENTNPDDGLIWLDGKIVTSETLIEFLQFIDVAKA